MGRNAELLTHAEAAKILDVTERHLRTLVRQGHLRPAKNGRRANDALYQPEEVHALLELRTRKLDLPAVASMALQAQATSRAMTRKLETICRFLGLENNQLGYDEDSIFNLHMKVQDALNDDPTTLRSGAILEWASIFNGIDEEYLRLLEHYTLNQSPWDIYLQLANDMMAKRSSEADSNLSFAYSCLDSARRSLRHVAYFYVVHRQGPRVADTLFTKGEVQDEIIAQLYPRILSTS